MRLASGDVLPSPLPFTGSYADNDHVLVSRSEFNLATPAGQFLFAGEFHSGTSRLAPPGALGVRFILETDTKILWADKDGNCLAAPVPIAVFDELINLTGQIFVIA